MGGCNQTKSRCVGKVTLGLARPSMFLVACTFGYWSWCMISMEVVKRPSSVVFILDLQLYCLQYCACAGI